MSLEIWHNPRCSKSRDGLALLNEKGLDPEVYLYMDTPPDRARLEKVLADLKMSAGELVRRGEQAFKDQNLQDASDEKILEAMLNEPRLIERPIVISPKGAVVGRPTEKILQIL